MNKQNQLNAPFRDINAFRDIFKQYFNPLVNFIYSRYIKDLELAKDITQATFARIWEKREEIVISTSIKSYLFQATKNKALDYIRANAEKTLELQESFRDYDIADENFDVDVHSMLIRELVQNALYEMKPKMKRIFEMNKFEGYTYEEIANELNISKRTVESNMARAFGILKVALKNSEIFDNE